MKEMCKIMHGVQIEKDALTILILLDTLKTFLCSPQKGLSQCEPSKPVSTEHSSSSLPFPAPVMYKMLKLYSSKFEEGIQDFEGFKSLQWDRWEAKATAALFVPSGRWHQFRRRPTGATALVFFMPSRKFFFW